MLDSAAVGIDGMIPRTRQFVLVPSHAANRAGEEQGVEVSLGLPGVPVLDGQIGSMYARHQNGRSSCCGSDSPSA